MSNILNVFNPPKSQPLPDSQADCVQCLSMSSLVMIAGGTFLASGRAFETFKPHVPKPPVNSAWVTSTRFAGLLVIGFGLIRGVEAFRVWESRSDNILGATSSELQGAKQSNTDSDKPKSV